MKKENEAVNGRGQQVLDASSRSHAAVIFLDKYRRKTMPQSIQNSGRPCRNECEKLQVYREALISISKILTDLL